MSVPLPPVLVVDDEKNMRLILQTMLGDEGYAVRAVESAEQGLKLLEHEACFMVITDARLGGMSGYDFLAKVRAQWPDLPVLMFTGWGENILEHFARDAHPDAIVAKPIVQRDLLSAVADVLRRAMPAAS